MFNRWAYVLFGFIGWAFLTPALYIFGLDQIADGVIVKAHEYFYIVFGLFFLIYPFIKGVQFWKIGDKGLAVGIILVGIVAPAVSGMMGIFLFEVIARAWTGKNSKSS